MRYARVGRMGRKGFTLVELLTAMVMVGILAAIAVPRLRGPIGKADAARVLSDLNTIRHASYEFLEEEGRFPRSSSPGQRPAEMGDGAPSFSHSGITYTWSSIDLRRLPGGLYGSRALGLLTVNFGTNTQVADAMKNHEAKTLGGALRDYYWTPRQAMFLILE